MRWAKRAARLRWWVITSPPSPSRTSWLTSSNSSISCRTSSEAVGSSSTSARGSWARARATRTRFHSPPERESTGRSGQIDDIAALQRGLHRSAIPLARRAQRSQIGVAAQHHRLRHGQRKHRLFLLPHDADGLRQLAAGPARLPDAHPPAPRLLPAGPAPAVREAGSSSRCRSAPPPPPAPPACDLRSSPA